MKKTFFAFITLASLSFAAFAANWTYDSSAKTISDGNWTLKVYARTDPYIGIGSSLTATADGNAYVAGSGDLDLTKPVLTSANATYLITDIATGALAIDDGKLTSVKFPRTLGAFMRLGGTSANGYGTGNWPRCLIKSSGAVSTSITNIVMDCLHVLHVDTASSVLWNLSNGGTQLKNLTLKLAKAQSIGKRALYCADSTACQALAKVDVSDWDLKNVETIGDEAMPNVCATGVLELSRVESIGIDAFASDIGLTGVELSSSRCMLKTLGAGAFRNATALRDVTIGGADGLVIRTNAFNGCSSLVSVIFTGAKPTYDLGDAETPVFGTSDQAARSIAFYVNTNRADWAAALAGVTPLSAADQATFAAAHPELPVPFGVAPAALFHTATDQLIGCAERYYSLETACDTFFGDSVTVSAPANTLRNGKYRADTLITATASLNSAKNGTFAAWYCDVDDSVRTLNPLQFKIDRDTYLFARMTHPWTFDPDAKTLSNGNWTLNAYVSSGQKLTLGLASGAPASGAIFNTTAGSGVLDLGGTVKDSSGTAYSITTIGNEISACPSSNKGLEMTAFFSPGTLTTVYRSWRVQMPTGLGWPTLRMMVLDETCGCSFAGWGCYLYCQWQLERLVLRLPNVYDCNGNSGALFWNADAPKTDLGWWRLDNVHTIGSMFMRSLQTNDGDGSNPGASCYGVLKLPNGQNISALRIDRQAFTNCRYLDGVDLGSTTRPVVITNFTSGTQSSLSYAFSRCRNLKQVRLTGSAIYLKTGAFISCPNLKSVTFNGPVPVVDDGSTSAGNVFAGAGEKGIVFSVPTNAAWSGVIAGATAVGAAEAAAFKAANPSFATPSATVAASVFRSDKTEYLATTAATTVEFEMDTFFGDRVVVSGAGAKDLFGEYPDGTTFTAVPSTNGTFAGWYGDVDDAVRLDRTIAVPTCGRAKKWLYARFTHPWQLKKDPNNGNYIDNGNWKIKVSSISGTSINVGSVSGGDGSSEAWAYYPDNTGSGTLDFGGDIVDATDSSKHYTISGLLSRNHSYTNTALKTFLSPGSLSNVSWGQIFSTAIPHLTTFIADEPTCTADWKTWAFSGQTKLTHMVLRLPKMTHLGDGGAFWSVPLTETDLGWWRLQSLTTVKKRMFRRTNSEGQGEASVKAYGTLELPCVREINTGAFRKCPNLEGLILGTNKNSYVTFIHTNAILKCDKLTKLVIGSKADLRVGEMGELEPGDSSEYKRTSDEPYPAWQDVTFLGPAPNDRAFGNLFTNVAMRVGAKDCVIYASVGQAGWDAAVDKTLNAAETAAAKPEGYLLGVWRAGATREEGGKAWVVAKASPWDPKGMVIFIH